MANFSSNIQVMQNIMDKLSSKIYRDFVELENLQNSIKSSLNFAQKTLERVNEDINYLLTKSRPEYGIFINGKNDINQKREAEYNWLVSSICGFENLYRSIPYFCTTIALEKIDENGTSEIIAGLTENTITKETFIAEKDKGAYVNGRRIRVSMRNNLKDSIVTLNLSEKRENVSNIFQKIKNIRMNNCPALDLAYIASGKYDASIIYNPNEYELSAGFLLIREAGGYLKQLKNNKLILASANDTLAKQLNDIIK